MAKRSLEVRARMSIAQRLRHHSNYPIPEMTNGNLPRRRVQRLMKYYGLTEQDYERLLKSQGGKCAICRHPPKTRDLSVDHDHKTGKVRGLLCYPCNVKLGRLQVDNEEQCERIIRYLSKTNGI